MFGSESMDIKIIINNRGEGMLKISVHKNSERHREAKDIMYIFSDPLVIRWNPHPPQRICLTLGTMAKVRVY